MGSDHAHPEAILASPRATDDTYCMTAIYYQDPFLVVTPTPLIHLLTRKRCWETRNAQTKHDKWLFDTQF